MEIYLIRHTTPRIRNGFVYGQLNVDVNQHFKEEAECVLKKLSRKPDYTYSSPLTRCRKLAAFLSDDVVTDKRLMELDFGEWEGQRWDDINKEKLQRWMADYVTHSPPGGETMHELQKRVLSFWNDLKNLNADRVAVITHSGIIRTLYAYFKELPLSSSAVFDIKIPYGSVLKVNDSTEEILHLG